MNTTKTTPETKTAVLADVKAQLIKNAIDSTYYVACGKVMARELTEKYGITLNEAQAWMSTVACDLVDKLREMN